MSAYHGRGSICVPCRGFIALLGQQSSDTLKMEVHSGLSVYIAQVPEKYTKQFDVAGALGTSVRKIPLSILGFNNGYSECRFRGLPQSLHKITEYYLFYSKAAFF